MQTPTTPMTPEDALIHLHRDGWRWMVKTSHHSHGPTNFAVAGFAPWCEPGDLSVHIFGAPDLAYAVARANAEAERLTAEHEYDPYEVAA